jgi:hypothetical protein
VQSRTVVAFLSLLTACSDGREQAMTLAEALAAGNRRALQVEIDRELTRQKPETPAKARMEALRQWIESQDGVLTAEVDRTILRTDPPVQQIWVTLESDPGKIETIGVVLDGKSLRFEID